MSTLCFGSEKQPLGELSNFWRTRRPILCGGREYPTSEHLYQALKFMYPGADAISLAYAEEIRRASTPYKSKLLANRQRLYRYQWQLDLNAIIDRYDSARPRADWEKQKLAIMETVLRMKFDQDEHCLFVLRSTRGHDLVERSQTDRFWGDGGDGTGQNWLGRLLVKIRDA